MHTHTQGTRVNDVIRDIFNFQAYTRRPFFRALYIRRTAGVRFDTQEFDPEFIVEGYYLPDPERDFLPKSSSNRLRGRAASRKKKKE